MVNNSLGLPLKYDLLVVGRALLEYFLDGLGYRELILKNLKLNLDYERLNALDLDLIPKVLSMDRNSSVDCNSYLYCLETPQLSNYGVEAINICVNLDLTEIIIEGCVLKVNYKFIDMYVKNKFNNTEIEKYCMDYEDILYLVVHLGHYTYNIYLAPSIDIDLSSLKTYLDKDLIMFMSFHHGVNYLNLSNLTTDIKIYYLFFENFYKTLHFTYTYYINSFYNRNLIDELNYLGKDFLPIITETLDYENDKTVFPYHELLFHKSLVDSGGDGGLYKNIDDFDNFQLDILNPLVSNYFILISDCLSNRFVDYEELTSTLSRETQIASQSDFGGVVSVAPTFHSVLDENHRLDSSYLDYLYYYLQDNSVDFGDDDDIVELESDFCTSSSSDSYNWYNDIVNTYLNLSPVKSSNNSDTVNASIYAYNLYLMYSKKYNSIEIKEENLLNLLLHLFPAGIKVNLLIKASYVNDREKRILDALRNVFSNPNYINLLCHVYNFVLTSNLSELEESLDLITVYISSKCTVSRMSVYDLNLMYPFEKIFTSNSSVLDYCSTYVSGSYWETVGVL